MRELGSSQLEVTDALERWTRAVARREASSRAARTEVTGTIVR